MFARAVHQLQIFPLLLVLLASVKFNSLISEIDFDSLALALSAIASVAFLAATGPGNKIKLICLAVALAAGLLLAIDFLYLHPSLGVLVLLFFMLIFQNVLDSDLKVPKSSVLTSYFLYLMPFFLVSPHEVISKPLLSFATTLAGISVLYLGFNHIGRAIKRISPLIRAIPLVGLSLYIFRRAEFLELISVLLIFATTALIGYIFLRSETVRDIEERYAEIFQKPGLVVVAYFTGAALIGCLLLQISASQADPVGNGHSLLDSLFTSMSAVCVTGLIVLDTPVDFSFFGQAVILLLIQLGGLGITSLSAWILLILSSGRLNLSHEEALLSMSGHSHKPDAKSLMKKIFLYFMTVEAVGAIVLFPAFWALEENWLTALWRAVFTSISAFCNAGFALQSDSLIPYQNQPAILMIVSLLIIGGGFAPLMALDLPKKVYQKRLSLQEKVVIAATGSLLAGGFFYFLFVEWNTSLFHLSFFDKVVNAWFQSVTARTAGFNSVDLTETRSVSQMFLMLLMFIGGNPGSTAGGVKTVTMAILAIAAFNALKEGEEAQVFYKRIPYKTVFQALLVVLLGLVVHFFAFFFLSVTQNIDSVSLLFETFSALGTVGLSTGSTALLDEIGKVIIMFCMLAGRTGPLTFMLILMQQQSHKRWKMPQEDLAIT